MVKKSKKDRFPTSRHWNHPTSFVTKKTYEELGVFRCEGIHDDFDLFLRIRRAKKKIVIKNVVLANFRTGGASNDKTLKNAFAVARTDTDATATISTAFCISLSAQLSKRQNLF